MRFPIRVVREQTMYQGDYRSYRHVSTRVEIRPWFLAFLIAFLIASIAFGLWGVP